MIAACIDFIAHERDMCLVHDLLEYGETSVKTRTYVDRLNLFLDERGLQSHCFVELMAQGIATWAGYKRYQNGQELCLGMLLGIRNYKLLSSSCPQGTILVVRGEQVFVDGEIGAFDCELRNEESQELLAQARLTVYQPQDEEKFLRKLKEGGP